MAIDMAKKKYRIRRKYSDKQVMCDCKECQKNLKLKYPTLKRVNDIFDGDKEFYLYMLKQFGEQYDKRGFTYIFTAWSDSHGYRFDRYISVKRSMITWLISTKKENVVLMKLVSKLDTNNRYSDWG